MRAPFILSFVSLLGCSSFPSADVRHAHAQRGIVSGARVEVPAAVDRSPYELPVISKGDRAVLVVTDSDAKPGWLDSGTAEWLLIEVPTLKPGSWSIGKDGAIAWYGRGSGWGQESAEEVRGTVEVQPGQSWIFDVRLQGRWRELNGRYTPIDLRHRFVARAVAFDEFAKRDSMWTRKTRNAE
jgi:hypothetical protein